MIQINDKIRIKKLDDLNLAIEKRHGKTWKIKGYYATLENAILSIYRDYLLDVVGKASDIIQLADALSLIRLAEDRIVREILPALHSIEHQKTVKK